MKCSRKAFITFLLASLIGFAGCTSPTPPPRNIILISLDTLRADHLGCYGYHRDTSPCIDTFAKESVIFEKAVVQSPWTLPSHMSIMTSLYPSFHGVIGPDNRLADEHVTLAELLKGAGYKTAAFADGAFLRKVYGFCQGFDLYDGDEKIGIKRILPKVKKWLDENKSKPFFLFLHCYDIHFPYAPPAPYDKIFHDFSYTGHLTPDVETIKAARYKKITTNDDDVRHFVALYDGGIRYTDAHIGEFLAYLKEAGLYDQSLIIITSDHGEEFKEHGSFDHWQLYYRPNLHVPLIMRIPDYPKKEIRIKDLAQSIDIMPTILELAGRPAHPKAQGQSLVSLINGQKTFLNRTIWKSYNAWEKDSVISFAEQPGESPGAYDCSIINDGYQMVYKLKPYSIELFNIITDPLTQNNIAEGCKDISERLSSKVNDYLNKKNMYWGPTATLDEETREQLKALGYVQ
jgi:arylsulfatase A-like enzyme